MANKSVLSNQDVNSAGGSKHGFALGQTFKFSMSTGMLLPVYSAFVNVGEKISGKPSFFIRADHLVAPVMGDVDVFVDCFFVPLRHIFAPFEQWHFQIEDNNTDLADLQNYVIPHFPVLNSGNVPFYFMNSTIFNSLDDMFVSYGFNLHRLLMHLGYNPQSVFNPLVGGSPVPPSTHKAYDNRFQSILLNTYSPNFPVYKFAAYQKIYMDYYRNTDFEGNNVRAYNVDSCYATGNVPLTGFANPHGDRSGMFIMRYRDINKDYFTAVHPAPLFSTIGMLPNASDVLSQMNNWLNDNNNVGNNVSAGPAGNFKQAIHPVANTGTLVDSSDDDSGRWSYAGDVLSFGSGPGSLVYYGANQNFSVQGSPDVENLHSHKFDIANAYESLNTSVLRGMFAFDKLLRITQRAGKHVDDQTLAHFGFKQPAGVSNETYVLKSFHSIFHFGEVTATAATTNADLGQMAGRGVAMMGDQKNFNFVAPCPGIFMAIMSCAPRRTYIGAVEKDGFKVYLPDFFKPSIDNLGQQPVFGYEQGNIVNANQRLRWQYRWMEDKVKFDKASYLFAMTDKAPWTFSYEAPYIADTDNVSQAYRSRLKVSPYDINTVFVNSFQGRPTYPNNLDDDDNFCNFPKWYLNDPFNVDFAMQFTRVSKMSIYGEPVLGGIC